MCHISVIVPNYNYGHYIEDCLNSLAVQTLAPTVWEVLVLDDGSSDDSLPRIKAWLAAHTGLRARLLPGEHAGHPGSVRNRGIAEARGRWIVCLDADDCFTPQALALLLEKAEQHPEQIIAADYLELGPPQRRVAIPAFDPDLIRTQHPCSHAICYPKALWQKIGGYDTGNLYEDWDFLLRAVAAGARWEAVPEVAHLYRTHGQGVSVRAIAHDVQAKADIVLRSPAFFPPLVRWWARSIRRQEPWAHAFPRGFIPSCVQLLQWREACLAQLGARAHAFFPKNLFEAAMRESTEK